MEMQEKDPWKKDQNQEPQPQAVESQKPKIIIPTEPPVEFEFCHDPPTMNALELDIVKLTAQVKRSSHFLFEIFSTNLTNPFFLNFGYYKCLVCCP